MSPDDIAYVNSLIGLPWRSGAKGPEAFNCWGLAMVIEDRCFGRILPFMDVDDEDVRAVMRKVATTEHRKCWTHVERPVHGGLVEMSSGKHPYHIGVYLSIDGGGVLHSHNPSGVCFDRIATLQAAGWRRFAYNDWIG